MGVGGTEDNPRGRARLRHYHLPGAPNSAEAMEETSTFQTNQGNKYFT